MADPRDREYAELIVDGCLGVQPGWQVLVGGNPQARPLLEEVCGGRRPARRVRAPARLVRGAPVPSLSWVANASLERSRRRAAARGHEIESVDALLFVSAPDNTRAVGRDRGGADRRAAGCVPARQRADHEPRRSLGRLPVSDRGAGAGGRPRRRRSSRSFSTAPSCATGPPRASGCEAIAAHFDAASEVRIVGEGTDLRLSLAGRTMRVDALGANLPGGEFFGCPLEDSAEGEISFAELPGRLSRARGRPGSGSASRRASSSTRRPTTNEAYLIETLDTDEGARRLGELGIGCNPGITRYMKNTLFDEKMDGTVHLALGNSYTDLGGVNESAIHWDLVKDLRPPGSRHRARRRRRAARRRLARVVGGRRACGYGQARTRWLGAGGGMRTGGPASMCAPEVLEHPVDRPGVGRAAEVERLRRRRRARRPSSRSRSSRRSAPGPKRSGIRASTIVPGGESGVVASISIP